MSRRPCHAPPLTRALSLPSACSYVRPMRRTRPYTLADVRPNSQRSAPPSLGSQLGTTVAKTDRQKTVTLQRPCLCNRSHARWLSPTCSLWFPPPLMDAHACSPYCAPMPSPMCLLLLVRALLLAHSCSPCYAPGAHLPHGDHLRLMKHLQHGGLAATYV
jgi:hypothetical protein